MVYVVAVAGGWDRRATARGGSNPGVEDSCVGSPKSPPDDQTGSGQLSLKVFKMLSGIFKEREW